MDNIGKSRAKHEDYEGFVEKFKPKKTTDDCYTPPYIYDVVLAWARKKCRIPEDAGIVRPFYPGGDYENYPYAPGDVVVDNPPFSIVTKIRRFYMERGIPFFLFAPHLTLLSSFHVEENITFIVADGKIIYENGADVSTDFITNMWPTADAVVVAGDLHKLIDRAVNENKAVCELPKHEYPPEVVSSAILGKFASRGMVLSFPRREVFRISKLESQRPKGKAIFGGGLLISERLAAERLAARSVSVWELSDREKKMVRMLSEY